jgi:hypothetical protein
LQAFTEGLIEGHIATDIIITISGWIITISGWAGPLPPAAGRGAYVIDPKEWQHSLLSIAAREVEFAGTTLNLVCATGDPRSMWAALKMHEVLCLMNLTAWMRPRRLALEPR